ncbi:endo-1,4-beta-xylanase [Xylanibacter muris]|uniref:Beta-xylanase n=1 Tax=Xylanibacter muris TaxID=2736290 RepID=A0ABX2ASN1_9BACT|nr:endo-1,4-beta-xylanase [Xylanibacter muris]NPD93209.1 endo-1,4-beta-xylanase [Xylanibacter muris]
MKVKICSLFVSVMAALGNAGAVPLTVCDFENYAIGTKWTLWRAGGASTATVEADPCNPGNKVLHVVLKDWGCHPEFVLPTELRGKALTERYPKVIYDLYRSAGDNDDWKQFAVFIGDQEVYRDEGYPYQGPKEEWQTKMYDISQASDDNVSNVIRLGIHHNNSDFYIDNIRMAGEYDDYVTAEDGGTLDYCVNNTSSSYKNISDNIYIPGGQTLNVRTSRYSEWTGKVAGDGTLNIYSGGERSYIGTVSSKGTTYPEWNGMSGEIHVYPYKDMVGSCGFYGLLMSSGTFQPDNIEASRYNGIFAGKKVVLHNGATIAVESGTRGLRFGELHTEPGSVLDGYYKKSTANSYYVVGASNTDAVLAGKIHASSSGNKVGLIKEGKGTYTITGNTNEIGAGIRLLDGTLLVDNNALEAKTGKKTGAVGSSGTVFVFKGATLGGNGSVGATTEVYGALRPGTSVPGTLRFADYTVAKSDVSVTLHPKANIVCRVRNAEEHDLLEIGGTVAYSNKTQDFDESDKMPRLTIELTEDASPAVNDEITLFTATRKTGEWGFTIRYPKACTWVVEQRDGDDGSFSVVAKVTSLDYSGQGDVADDDDDTGGNGGYPDDDWTADLTDDTPLRVYAQKLGKEIGVAVASYRYDCSRNDGETGLVGNEFNIVVGENEMKFDATEPNQGEFNYGGSDAVMWVADRFSQEVRGHTLAWHQQVPKWVSEDGKKNNHGFTKKELLNILKNHIFNVVGKYKGKIREWDVCNEVLDDDQSIVRTDPDAYKLRPSIWATYIGEEFIDSAFVWAHRADPQAKLYINDYGVEFAGDTKTEAYFNLIKRLKASKLPVDGCGLQCHLTTGQLDTLKLEKNIRRYAGIGLKCIITELDISLANPYSADALDIQAKEYGAITRVFLRNENCPSMLVWGISDNHSWRQNQPLLFDSNLKAKPAYYNVHAQLRLAAEKGGSGIVPVGSDIKDKELSHIIMMNVNGQRMTSPKGLVIEKRMFSDGTSKVEKKLYR